MTKTISFIIIAVVILGLAVYASNSGLPNIKIEEDIPMTQLKIEDIKAGTGAEAKAGDFLCKGPKGDMGPVDQEVFAQTYRPADPPKMEKVFKRK